MTSVQQTGDFHRLKRLLLSEEQQVLSRIGQTLRKHELRVGDDDALMHSVAVILADALREAEVRNHRELAAAIAPVIVASIKQEIRNASDEVVDALYPIMGRLIRAYVASAIRDFVEQTNRRIEGGLSARFLRLRIRSLFTATPYRTLLIREGQDLRVSSIYLIERGSGTLIESWNSDMGAADIRVDDHLIGGMLTAINNFAASVFAEEESELRALDLGEARVFIRASASHLVAMKTVGKGNRKIRRSIDLNLQNALETLANRQADTRQRRRETLAALADTITNFLAQQKQPPVLALGLFGGLALLAGLIAYQHHREQAAIADLKSEVLTVIDEHASLRPSRLSVEVAKDRQSVAVSGHVSSAAERDLLIREASARLDPVALRPQIVVLSQQSEVSTSIGEVRVLVKEKSEEAARQSKAALASAQSEIAQLNSDLEARSAELDKELAELRRLTQDPLLKLSQWVAMHAVFFADETTLRDPELALNILQELRDLLTLTAASIRIIGYTDPTGTADGNDALATLRAEKVAGELERLGVPRERMKILGRPRGTLLSYDKGPFSSNRRVEFEIAYLGEPTRPTGEPLTDHGPRP